MIQASFPFALPPASPSPTPPAASAAAQRRAEAADAGTPFARLAELAATNPREVLRNPAFELALVTEPGFLFSLSEQALCMLVRQPAFPADLMVALAQRRTRLENGGRRVAPRIAMHPDAPREALDLLADEPFASLNVNARTAFGEPWMDLVLRITDPRSRTHPRLLLNAGDGRVTAALARHGCIDGSDPFVHRVLLREVGPGTTVRYVRAQRSMSTAHIRAHLRTEAERTAEARRGIAHLNRQRQQQERAAQRVERAEFCGELGPRDDPSQLARSTRQADRMRATMAIGDRLPDERLRNLLVDRQWQVRSAVGLRPQLSIADSWALARDPDPRVRAHVANATPHPAVLRHLAADADLRVQHAVAQNLACTPEIEGIVADVERILDSLVAAWAKGSPLQGNGLPLGRAEPNDAWAAEDAAILALRHSYDALPRAMFVAGPRCPVEVIEDHADSSCWWVRVAVARNLRTPRAVVESLASGDANWLVRAAAAERVESGAFLQVPSAEALPLLAPSTNALPEPIPADLCSERHMPRDSREEMTALCNGLRSTEQADVLRAIDRAFEHPVARRHLLAGMLITRQRVRLTGFSEIGRKVAYQFRSAAEQRVARLLGCTAEKATAA